MDYRREIDGLRALAVLPVILFHSGIEIFAGGFVGVDVFFVISGYLITAILLEDIEKGKFSLKNFYIRRIKRIFPALLAVLFFTYIVSYFVFLPGPHKVVGQYVIASIFSASNILLYFKGNDYFGLEEGRNPLFHTWSLGVEEQFYVVFPVLLFILWKLGKDKAFISVIALALFSLLLSELGWRENMMANFYFAHTRAWELLIGAIAAFIHFNRGMRANNALSIIGFLSIILSIVAYDSSTPFPSVYTLAPVVGAFLIILFAGSGTFIAKILSFRIMVLIGLVSYSAYLWHIPLQIYTDYLFSNSPYKIAIFFFSLIFISILSYRYVELPFRTKLSTKVVLIIVLLSTVLLTSIGVIGHLNGGYPSRNEIFTNLQHNNGWGLKCNGNTEINEICSTSASPKLAVLGNSFAMVWVNPIRSTSAVDLVQLTQDSCAVGFVDQVEDVNAKPCAQFYQSALKTIIDSSSVEQVIISSPFTREVSSENFQRSFSELLHQLNKKQVIIIGPTPRAPFNVGECILKSKLYGNLDCGFAVKPEHYQKIKKLNEIVSDLKNVKFIDITESICTKGRCEMKIGKSDAMYIDSGHLSNSGALRILKDISSELE